MSNQRKPDITLSLKESIRFLKILKQDTIDHGKLFKQRTNCTDREHDAYCAGYFDSAYIACYEGLHPDAHLKGH